MSLDGFRFALAPVLALVLTGLCPALAAAAPADPIDRTVERTITSHSETFDVTSADVYANRGWFRLENTGTTEIQGAKLYRADRDWTTIDGMLASVLRPGMSSEQKARAIWQMVRDARFSWYAPNPWVRSDDPVEYLNFYGYGFCSDSTFAMLALFKRAGFPVRWWNPGTPPQHVVPEVFYDNAWHMFDADREGLYLLRDNQTVAGVTDLIADPDLVRRAGPLHADLVDIYARTPSTAVYDWEPLRQPIDLGLTLRPREAITFYWVPRGRARVVPVDQQPPMYANAELVSSLAASTDDERWLSASEGVALALVNGGPAYVAVTADTPGLLAYQVRSAYPIVEVRLSTQVIVPAADDLVELFASSGPDLTDTPTLVWSSAVQGEGQVGRVPVTLDLSDIVTPIDSVTPTNVVTLYARMRSPRARTTGISGLNVLSILQVAPRALPSIERGTNAFVYSDRSSEDTQIRITQGWRERPDAHRPSAPVLTTTSVKIENPFAMTWEAATDEDGDPMLRYQIRICADPACDTPLSAIFDQIVWMDGIGLDGIPGTYDDALPGPTISWTVNQPDWFTPGRTYYWSVRAQDTSLLWGDYSTPQPFVAKVSEVLPPFRYLLAEGATGGFFDTELAITNPNELDAPVSLRFATEQGHIVRRTLVVPALARRTLRLSEDQELAAAATFSIEAVSVSELPLAIARTMFWGPDRSGGHADVAVREESTRWYFAEGAQGYFNTYVLVGNLRATQASVTARFMTEQQQVVERRYDVQPGRRLTIDVSTIEELANQTFAIELESDAPVVAERAMYFGPGWPGGHATAGATHPANTWFHAEGATGSYFTTFILVGNPNDQPADLTFDFATDTGVRVRTTRRVEAHARFTLNIADADPSLAFANVATSLQATLPVIAERVTYWPGGAADWQDATGSLGSSTTGTRWAVADARIGGPRGYQTYVLLANGTDDEAQVTVRALPVTGTSVQTEVTVEPNSRLNVQIGDLFPQFEGQELGVRLDVVNDVPISVEQSLYWNANGIVWAGGASALGVPLP